ncbi:DUF3152 domain-containing protein [Nocardioides euryhalodurans]|uniref:DUF3152 domain-containing protein n=1 Tax=Nocardioides euryhalodurans TaxID=2518370 RepID=A0A4P7GP13_9ACTN|nr:DUF3152 domain-containing protein [Nocardioides euryhalodurans]QBR93840.1 DUF3152 domain-containing protein [Nocardioides euryhalodurans]
MGLRLGVVTAVAALVTSLLTGVAGAQGTVPPTSTAPPTVTGEPAYRQVLRAQPGTWTSESQLTYDYQWLRDGRRLRGETSPRRRATLRDIGSRLSVRITATDEAGQTATATSEPTDRVRRADLVATERPGISGTMRFTRTLTADPGEWAARRRTVSFRWLRGGDPIEGATGRRYTLQAADVGRRIRVRVTARAEGYLRGDAVSRQTREVGHRVPVRRTVTYRIETRGRIVADRDTFRRQVAQTFADPRGWRSAGVQFRRVSRGGSFSVVLAEASRVPDFSPVCSATWSCRVGRYVIINQTRWRFASPSWNAANRPVREYRHMVVNHETGHWLGHGHLGCSARGRKAPVMMQQSKGLDGCRHNPWPLSSELWFG